MSIAIASALSLLCAHSALAQQNEATLKETTVSSESDKPVQERTELGKLTEITPISGAVVDKEEIEHLQIVNGLLELGKRVPGISMVRNMRIPDGGKLYTESRIDGMRATTTNTSILDEVDLADVDHIDVITGPGAALYGSGALGGTISVFTRQPPQSFKAGCRRNWAVGAFSAPKATSALALSTGAPVLLSPAVRWTTTGGEKAKHRGRKTLPRNTKTVFPCARNFVQQIPPR
ncbi:MAG TPA: TonB-dependent receptor plug domain-containing protein [Rhodoferax sp.]